MEKLINLTLVCPSCGTDTPSEYNFCLNCNKQVKCLGCNKILVAGKTFCFYCGQPSATTNAVQDLPNKYTRKIIQRGKNYEEYTEFNVSNHAVSKLAPFIVDRMTSRPQQQPNYRSKSEGFIKLPHEEKTTDGSAKEEGVHELPPREPEVPSEAGISSKASRYFERDGEYLVATEKDFRGKTWKEQQKNFILLYTSAYSYFFQKPVPLKDHYKTAAKKNNVIDRNNFSRYLAELKRQMLSELGDGYKLNNTGENEVRGIITRMKDEKAESGYSYWGHTASSSTNRVRLGKDDKNKLKEWTQKDVQLGNLDVRNIKKPRDYAMVTLWIITIHLKEAEAVRWNDAYYYFKEKYTTISAKPEAFSRALANPKNEKYFNETDDKYYLTIEAQRVVEEWIKGKNVEPLSEAES